MELFVGATGMVVDAAPGANRKYERRRSFYCTRILELAVISDYTQAIGVLDPSRIPARPTASYRSLRVRELGCCPLRTVRRRHRVRLAPA